ncbi:MAG TPA: MMPL family transporter, partial [Thermoleophilaceae bacterium]|nr:MMPL family transporter [Thermoleophilaceae bacterium]
MQAKGIAARMGRWSSEHRKAAIFGWLAFVVISVVVGMNVGSKKLTDAERVQGEAGKAEQAIVDAGMDPPAGESILISSDTMTTKDRAFQLAIADVERRVDNVRVVENVETGLTSKDGHAALVTFDVKGDPETADEHYDAITAPAVGARAAHPEFQIQQFGDASSMKEIEDMFMDDLHKAETLSLPATLVILLLAFGALVAAGLPVLLALSAVAATIGLVALPSQLLPIDDGTASVIVLIGMAVGVDYSLFYMRREREERAAGYDSKTAVQRAAQTSGRAVLISGVTVMTAMAGMFLSGEKGFIGIGLGAMVVVGVAMIGSLTVLPAMMAWLGDRVEKGRVPFVGRRRAEARESRMWGAIVDRVLRRPVVSAVAAGAFLVALAIPALGMKTVTPSPSDYPKDLPAVQAYEGIQKAFPGKEFAATVVVENGNLRSGEGAAALAELEQQALASGQMTEPVTTRYSDDGTVAEVSIPLAGDGADAESRAALQTLRDEIVPATVGTVGEVNVSGMTAQTVDAAEGLSKSMPLVFGFVLILAFGLLLVTFRSIVVPIKAIVLNLLSVFAAYGVLKVVFQDGLGESLLGFESNGGVSPWVPLFLFVVLFGLSMDYHVFILSRIREAFDSGMSTEQAVASGIKSTAGVVTSAAVVMIAVFSIFASLSAIEFKQMGV